jgi:transcription antitermination factor NusG
MTIYLPEIMIASRSRKSERLPFFPGYFFIRVDLADMKLSSINASPGVHRVLDFGSGPQVVPQSLISTIQEMLCTINAGNTLPPLPHYKLSPGDVVRIKNGPFEGLEATFVQTLSSHERVQIMLHFLGELNKTQIDVDQLEKIKDAPILRTARCTRGRGRHIHSPISV